MSDDRELLELAAESGMPVDIGSVIASYDNLKRFAAKIAAKVAAAEREECAKVCDAEKIIHQYRYSEDDIGAESAAENCALLIRARGNKGNETQNANG